MGRIDVGPLIQTTVRRKKFVTPNSQDTLSGSCESPGHQQWLETVPEPRPEESQKHGRGRGVREEISTPG